MSVMLRRGFVFALAVFVGGGGLAFSAAAAPKAELWARWERHNPDSVAVVDHSVWDAFLGQYLQERDGINLLDYDAAEKGEGKGLLKAYLDTLQKTPVSDLNRDEQRAFWINLYNALTADVVISNYPVDSIRDIEPGLFGGGGPWQKKLAQVEGEMLSLDDIEHRILRPIWQDARVHYAVNCASIGCPNLMTNAFTAENTEALLREGARDFINHPRGADVNAGGALVVSSIYEWFAEDFGGDDSGIIAHLRKYADDDLRGKLANVNAIADDDYDWRLNKP
ncbi:MAG: DUF547 domain-containing protein [Gammaproteobacteria bacterium]